MGENGRVQLVPVPVEYLGLIGALGDGERKHLGRGRRGQSQAVGVLEAGEDLVRGEGAVA